MTTKRLWFKLAPAALVVTLVVPLSAGAQAPDPLERPGVELAVRTGYAIPFGKIDGDAARAIGDEIYGGVPLVVEVGARIDRGLTVGLTFQYAILQAKNTAEDGCGQNGLSCSGSDVHLGLELLYHLPPTSAFVPWLGVATGYEWLSLNESGGGQTGSGAAHGFEFLTLQAGGDVRLAPQFALGPFVSFSVGQFGTEAVELNGTSTSADVTNTTLHEWLELGVRGTLDL
jgi:hypothetical protein